MTDIGEGAIVLADHEFLLGIDPPPDCQMNLTQVRYSCRRRNDDLEIFQIQVCGVSWGVKDLIVRLVTANRDPTENSTQVAADSNEWRLMIDFDDNPIPYGAAVAIEATGSGNNGDCTAADSSNVVLGPNPSLQSNLVPADACTVGFLRARNHFAAGNVDKFIYRRAFIPLACGYFVLTTPDVQWVAKGWSKLGVKAKNIGKAVSILAANLGDGGAQWIKEREGKSFELDSAYKVIGKAFEEAKKSALGNRRRRGKFPQGGLHVRQGVNGTHFLVASVVDDLHSLEKSFKAYVDGLFSGGPVFVGSLTAEWRLLNLGWLGIMYYDRLRFRPTSMAPGEQVFSLSMAPGEEVTLTQKTITKKSRSFEEVLGTEQETELEFSSTWSTDINQQAAETESHSTGGNLSAQVSAPIEGVQVSLGGGINAQDANTQSSSQQIASSQQITNRIVSKFKQQHKTTFKVGTDETEEFGSKRIVRNPNHSRALTLQFYKLYQKYRVVLERYNAKLCLNACIWDPGMYLRKDLRDELSKFNPDLAVERCPDVPAPTTEKIEKWVYASYEAGAEYGTETFSVSAPSNTVLASWNLEIVSWQIDDDGQIKECNPNEFSSFSGWWEFRSGSQPVVGAGDGHSHTVRFKMPEKRGPGWHTYRILVRFTWRFVPSNAITDQVRSCIETERARIRDSFSLERFNSIVSKVREYRFHYLFRRILEDYFMTGPLHPCVPDASTILEEVRGSFDWNEAAIEYMPWWMTASGVANRESLKDLMLHLPQAVPYEEVLDDHFVASIARVYLPVKEGYEEEAIRLIAAFEQSTDWILDQCVNRFRKWREDNVGPLDFVKPTYDEIDTAMPSMSTPLGHNDFQDDWERPRRRFLVLDEWSEFVPTDGVHLEPTLSECSSMDSYRTTEVLSGLTSSIISNEIDRAKADLMRSLRSSNVDSMNVSVRADSDSGD